MPIGRWLFVLIKIIYFYECITFTMAKLWSRDILKIGKKTGKLLRTNTAPSGQRVRTNTTPGEAGSKILVHTYYGRVVLLPIFSRGAGKNGKSRRRRRRRRRLYFNNLWVLNVGFLISRLKSECALQAYNFCF